MTFVRADSNGIQKSVRPKVDRCAQETRMARRLSVGIKFNLFGISSAESASLEERAPLLLGRGPPRDWWASNTKCMGFERRYLDLHTIIDSPVSDVMVYTCGLFYVPRRFLLTYFILYLHGIGHLLPWNMFITAHSVSCSCWGGMACIKHHHCSCPVSPVLLTSVYLWCQYHWLSWWRVWDHIWELVCHCSHGSCADHYCGQHLSAEQVRANGWDLSAL